MFDAFLSKIATALVTPFLLVGSLFGQGNIEPVIDPLGAQLPAATAVFETSLAAPISSSATTMTLTANSVRGGGSLSGFNCFTVDEGSAQAETICGTVSGTTVSSLSRGISQITGTSTDADLQFAHRRGANVKITDFPVIQILKAQNNGEDTFENSLVYASSVGTSTVAFPSAYHIVNRGYVDAAVLAPGSVITATETSGGFVEIATDAEVAAGTTNGSVSRLAIPASSATSTRNASTAANKVIVSNTNGTIDAGWIASSTNFTVTGTTTMATTTTIGSTYAFNIGKNQQVFTNSGTFTIPNGIKTVWAEVIGGGAGGAENASGGGGGGGGAYCLGAVDVSATTTVGVVIGSAGAAGAVGGESRFGSFINAGGGAAGSSQTGGAGGDCTGSATNMLEIENFDGMNGLADTGPTPDFANTGDGGGNVYGEGGQGRVTAPSGASGNIAGAAGTGYGTGGSGAVAGTAGAGMAGLVRITW